MEIFPYSYFVELLKCFAEVKEAIKLPVHRCGGLCDS